MAPIISIISCHGLMEILHAMEVTQHKLQVLSDNDFCSERSDTSSSTCEAEA